MSDGARSRAKAETKKCRKCNVDMVAGCFYKDDRYTDGLYPYCRICKSDMGKCELPETQKGSLIVVRSYLNE